MDWENQPTCSTCDGNLGYPVSFNQTNGLHYNCPMCSMTEATTWIPLSDLSTDYLHNLFTYASRVDASIRKSDDSPRFEDLRQAVKSELRDRGESVTEIELSHVVYTTKAKASEIKTEYPGFFTIGRAIDSDGHELGTPQSEIEWKSFVAPSEAEQLAQQESIEVEPVSSNKAQSQ